MPIDQPFSTGNPHILKPSKALNKAFLKIKPNSSQIDWQDYELFKLTEDEIALLEDS